MAPDQLALCSSIATGRVARANASSRAASGPGSRSSSRAKTVVRWSTFGEQRWVIFGERRRLGSFAVGTGLVGSIIAFRKSKIATKYWFTLEYVCVPLEWMAGFSEPYTARVFMRGKYTEPGTWELPRTVKVEFYDPEGMLGKILETNWSAEDETKVRRRVKQELEHFANEQGRCARSD